MLTPLQTPPNLSSRAIVEFGAIFSAHICYTADIMMYDPEVIHARAPMRRTMKFEGIEIPLGFDESVGQPAGNLKAMVARVRAMLTGRAAARTHVTRAKTVSATPRAAK